MTGVVAATEQVHGLAEGPVWDAERSRLLWVDILAGTVFEGRLAGARIEAAPLYRSAGTVGAVAPGSGGSLVVAAQEELVVLRSDGATITGPRVVPDGAGRRLNDGAVDPAGRFLVGTLSLAGGSQSETLVRWEHDGTLTELDDDLTLSNGLAWSADGRSLYSVDTLRGVVYRRAYDPGSGAVGDRRVHLRLEGGHPDGIALDTKGHLWVAVWGAGEVRRFTPDGSFAGALAVPAPHTSSVAFAGDDLRTLVVTTATAELTDDQRLAYPDSGRLFTTRVDVPGLPTPVWSGHPVL